MSGLAFSVVLFSILELKVGELLKKCICTNEDVNKILCYVLYVT